MRFLTDENIGPTVELWLREQGHDVFSIFESARGLTDEAVLTLAFSENRILITSDKDFGEKIFRERWPHRGVILLRLRDERAAVKMMVLQRLLSQYPHLMAEQFLVASETRVRFARS